MTLEWEQVVIDCAHPPWLGRWWADALGWQYWAEDVDVVEIRPSEDRLPGLIFVPVADPKAVKNRLHLDLRPDDQDREVARLLDLGATRSDIEQGDRPWVVLADPEGNEFCLLSSRTAGGAAGDPVG